MSRRLIEHRSRLLYSKFPNLSIPEPRRSQRRFFLFHLRFASLARWL